MDSRSTALAGRNASVNGSSGGDRARGKDLADCSRCGPGRRFSPQAVTPTGVFHQDVQPNQGTTLHDPSLLRRVGSAGARSGDTSCHLHGFLSPDRPETPLVAEDPSEQRVAQQQIDADRVTLCRVRDLRESHGAEEEFPQPPRYPELLRADANDRVHPRRAQGNSIHAWAGPAWGASLC
jgi:hypothetical protein